MAGTRWVKLDTQYASNPKIYPLSDAAFRLHVVMITYSAEQLTDGLVRASALNLVLDRARIARRSRHATRAEVVRELVDAGLLDVVPDGYVLHDFAEINSQSLRAVVEREREQTRERQRRYRDRQDERRSDVTPL